MIGIRPKHTAAVTIGLKIVRTSRTAIARLKKQYVELMREAKLCAPTRTRPTWPQRARKIRLRPVVPDPERDKTRPVKESARVTYGVVFGFTSVENVYLQWRKSREELEPFAKLQWKAPKNAKAHSK